MKQTDLLIIGGSAGGLLSATSARKMYGDIDITVIRETPSVMVPCGIPYIYGTLKDTNKNVIPDAMLTDAGVHLIVDSALAVDKSAKTVSTRENGVFQYKKLILATGSLPIIPKFIPGHDLENVFPVYKRQDYLAEILVKLEGVSNVAVIGGGFIGVEFAEQVRSAGKNVTIVEMAGSCLWQAFDKKYCDELEASMRDNGIQVKTGVKVNKILGEGSVSGLQLDDGTTLDAEMVILGLGVTPNGALGKEAGLLTNEKGALVVDQYTRTSDPDIFAVGDCAEKKCFFTGKDTPVLLASTAAMEAKIAGCNAFDLKLIRANKGTISAFSTKVYGRTYASAGLTESRATQEGFSIITGEFATMDRHPGSLPGVSKVDIKLIFAKDSGILLGAQISGGDTAAEMINILSLAIQQDCTATELNTFQVATHPLISASPIAYPINAAAMSAIVKGLCK